VPRVTTLRIMVAALLAAVLLAGCGSGGGSAGPTTSAEPGPLDARAVLAKFTAAGLPLTGGSVQDDSTDPDDLLGRKDGYSSRASFDLPGADTGADPHSIGRGGVIEVWPDASGAKARADHFATLEKDNPMMGNDYRYLSGPVLVRITGRVDASLAAKFGAIVATLGA
jgi:hypothetical protein